jgi:hypothetical protein
MFSVYVKPSSGGSKLRYITSSVSTSLNIVQCLACYYNHCKIRVKRRVKCCIKSLKFVEFCVEIINSSGMDRCVTPHLWLFWFLVLCTVVELLVNMSCVALSCSFRVALCTVYTHSM